MKHTIFLYREDCLNVIPFLSPVDLILVDPPYGTTKCRWDTIIPLDKMWLSIKCVIKKHTPIVFMSQNPFTAALIMSEPKMFRQSLVWCKNKASGHLNANRRHLTKHEDIVIFSEKQGTYNQQKTQGHKPANYAKRASQSKCYNIAAPTVYDGGNTTRCPTSLIEIPVINNDNSREKRVHPTQKPVELMEYLIKTYSNENDTVLDFAMGSGTTGVACKKLNRRFVGIEKDKDHFKTAQRRILGDVHS